MRRDKKSRILLKFEEDTERGCRTRGDGTGDEGPTAGHSSKEAATRYNGRAGAGQ